MEMQYELIGHESVVGLSDLVTERLNQGWSLYGNPVITPIAAYQAVTGFDLPTRPAENPTEKIANG